MNTSTAQVRSVCVFGLGYVGSVTAACLSQLGHKVTGVDRDEFKVRCLNNGDAPFVEPGLGEIISGAVQAGRLRATTNAEEGLKDADVALLCVGTPSESNGNLGLDQLYRVVEEIGVHLPRHGKRLIVAVRSTVFPGTCEDVVTANLSGKGDFAVVSNPEFLREGCAIKDFLEPSLLVVGGTDREAMQCVADLYSSLDVTAHLVNLRTAEMIKYACNAFHALKIGFANEVGSLGVRLGVDANEVMSVLCQDVKLNVSAAYLKPGFAFGGSCLPKDLRALSYRASRLDMKLPLLESILPSNERHLQRAIDNVLRLGDRKIGVIGLTFKENTDDLRESPVLTMLEFLLGKGRQFRVWDANIQLSGIYGSNLQYLLNSVQHIGRLLDENLDTLLGWAECLVVTQKQDPQVREKIRASGLPVLDLSTM